MDEDIEFNDLYLPDLMRCVVAIFSVDEDSELSVGSGVLVNVGGRHLIATAAHCIKNRPQVMRCISPVNTTHPVEMHGARILRTGWHPNNDLDIGFLEIEDPNCLELEWGQLGRGPVGSEVHIVGYPSVRESGCLPGANHPRSKRLPDSPV